MKGLSLLGGLGAGITLGFAGALIFCWFTWVRPLQANLDAREKSLQEWERIQRLERENISTMKTVSTEEVRKWVATVDEQNTHFAKIQRLAHEQELQLVGPAQSLIFVALAAVLGVVGLVVYLLRDSNASAAITLDNIAGLAPEQMIRAALAARTPEALGTASRIGAVSATLHSQPMPLTYEVAKGTGVVQKYDNRDAFGWIELPDESTLFFHRNDVHSDDRRRIRPGVPVSFRRGQDEKGRPAALEVRVWGRNHTGVR